MLTAITAWLVKDGAALLLGALAKLALDALNAWRADQAIRDLGAAQARNEQARATIDAQQRQLEAQANAPATTDDAIKRLEDGTA